MTNRNLDKLAPIVLFVYNRPEHTKRTVESLIKNSLASKSALFIFSDGANRDKDEQNVKAVRDYIITIKGFDKIEIVVRKKNYGLANSVISGINEVFNSYDNAIVLEDDIISSPYFLKYMNEVLNFFEDDIRIYSVTGYTFPIKIPKNYNNSLYLSPRASSWGWGTWKDRWEKVDWEVKDFTTFDADKKAQKLFNSGGEDLTPMLKAQMRGKIDSWAIRWSYAHFKNNSYCLYPIVPQCKNIGTDKSGTHSSASQKLDITLFDREVDINLTNDLNPNDEIIELIKKLVKPSPIRYIINTLKDYLH